MKYKFSTLKEIFDTVPPDKLELCMTEIGRGLAYAAQTRALINAAAGDVEAVDFSGECVWIDDGLRNVDVTVLDKDGGELMRLHTEPGSSPTSPPDAI
jgi:hypothetical protein